MAGEVLDELVFQVLERRDAGDEGALEALCLEHPALAGELRRRVESLRASGLLTGTLGAPERLGEFRLLRRLGEGGMGVVYLAEQPSLGRRVAVKLVRPDQLYFRGARERFRREVEAVARLAHPGIVPVHSVGEHEGLPYYAMELIEGASLAELLARLAGREPARLRGQDLRAALLATCAERGFTPAVPDDGEPLFRGSWSDACAWICREVAQALEHAHQRGVLHRDVKPSNVLLTPGGRVMLVDFGLASTRGDARITAAGSRLGSLAYMAPEALAGDSEHVGPRADVYSLGAMLYELYTLRLPFESKDTAELARRIAAGRPARARSLHAGLALDAETVCDVAMEADPARRYASAAHLARDLTNLLERRPIEARPPGPGLVLRRWAQRHPALATAAAAGVLLALGGPLAYGLQEMRARQRIEEERDVARDAQKRAENAEGLARQQRDAAQVSLAAALDAIELLLERVGHRDLRDVPRVEPLRRELLERASTLYARVEASVESDPDLRLRTASALGKLARLRRETGDMAGALEGFEAAEQRLRALAAERPEDPRVLFELGNLLAFASVARPAGVPGETVARLEPAVELLRRAVELAPSERRPRSELARGLLALAHFEDIAGAPAPARKHWEESLALAEALRAEVPSEDDALELWATALSRLATLASREGEHAASERDFERMLAQTAGVARPSSFLRQMRALNLQMLARARIQREGPERDAEIARLQRAAETELRALVRDFPTNDAYMASLESSLHDLGDRALKLGDNAAALAAFDESLRLSEQAAALAPGDARRIRSIGLSQDRLARAFHAGGDTETALVHARAAAQAHARAVELWKRPESLGERADALRALMSLAAEGQRLEELAAAAHALAAEAPAGPLGFADLLDAGQGLVFAARSAAQAGEDARAAEWTAAVLPILERALALDPARAPRLLQSLRTWEVADDPAFADLRRRLETGG